MHLFRLYYNITQCYSILENVYPAVGIFLTILLRENVTFLFVTVFMCSA
jgi:hypothetical protein